MLYIALGFLLVLAVFFDMRSRRIPNALTFSGMALGLILNVITQGWPGLQPALEGLVIAGFVGLCFWYTQMIGGADHKLLMAVGAFVGWPQIVPVMVAVALAGGVQALVWTISARRGQAGAVALSWRTALRTTRMPYSLAIAVGTFAVLALSYYGIL